MAIDFRKNKFTYVSKIYHLINAALEVRTGFPFSFPNFTISNDVENYIYSFSLTVEHAF